MMIYSGISYIGTVTGMTATGTTHTLIITIPGSMIPGIMIPGTTIHGITDLITTGHTIMVPHITEVTPI